MNGPINSRSIEPTPRTRGSDRGGQGRTQFVASAIRLALFCVEKFLCWQARLALARAGGGGLPTRRGCPPSRDHRSRAGLTRTSPSCTAGQKGHYRLWREGRRASIPWKAAARAIIAAPLFQRGFRPGDGAAAVWRGNSSFPFCAGAGNKVARDSHRRPRAAARNVTALRGGLMTGCESRKARGREWISEAETKVWRRISMTAPSLGTPPGIPAKRQDCSPLGRHIPRRHPRRKRRRASARLSS